MANEVPIYNGLLQSNLAAGGNSITGLGGATLTAGHITLFQNPATAMHAVTKQYADAIAGSASPQRGLVAGTGLNFAQNADYTVGQIPLATGTTTMGFSADIAWDDVAKSMTLNGLIGEIDQIFFDASYTPLTTPVGSMWWNSVDSTVNVKCSSNVTAQLGQEVLVRGYNDTGSTITQGTAVSVIGSLLGDVEFGLASNATPEEALGFIGIATEDIPTGTQGFACRFGLVRGLNTNPWNEGDRLYLGTAGGLQNTSPPAPATSVAAALVVVKSLTEGVLLTDFRISSYQIDSASDYIESGARAAGSLMVRNAANTAWTDTAAEAYFIEGTPALFSSAAVVGTSTALSAGSSLTVWSTHTHTSGTNYGLVSSTQWEAPSASTGTMAGCYFTGNTTNSAAASLSAATLNGLLINYGHSNTASDLKTYRNLYSYAIHGPGAGTVTDFHGADFYCDVQGGATRVTNLYELLLRSYVPSTYATNHWGIYQANQAASNFFAGKVGLKGATGVAGVNLMLWAYDPGVTVVSGSNWGINVQTESTPASPSSTEYRGIESQANVGTSSTQNYTGSHIGVYAQATNKGTGTVTELIGVRGRMLNNGSGVVASAKGLSASVYNLSGTITNGYGLYIDPLTALAGSITNKYGIYQEGSEQNYLGGALEAVGNLVVGGTAAIAGSVRMGATTAPNWDRALNIERTYSGTNYQYGVYNTLNYSTTASGTAQGYAMINVLNVDTAFNTGSLYGLHNSLTKSGAGSSGTCYGFISKNTHNAGSSLESYPALLQYINAGGSVTTGSALRVETYNQSGTTTDLIGIAIVGSSVTGGTATSRYGIIQTGTSDYNYFRGLTYFGSSGKALSTVHLDYAADGYGAHTAGLRCSTSGSNAYMLTHSYTSSSMFGIKYVAGASFPFTVDGNSCVIMAYQDHTGSKRTLGPVGYAYRTVPNGTVGTFEVVMECARDSAQIGPYDAYGVVGRFLHTSGLLLSGSDTAGVYGVQEWNSTAGGNGGTISSGVFGEVIGASSSTFYPSQLVGVRSRVTWGSATATAPNIYGFKLENMAAGLGGVGTSYGLYLGNQVGTTKYGVYQADSTASNVFAGPVSFTGNVTFTGNTTSNDPWASIYVDEDYTTTTLVAVGTYYVLNTAGWTTVGSDNVTVNTTNGRMTPLVAGYYLIAYNLTLENDAGNEEVYAAVAKNGVTPIVMSKCEQYFDTANRAFNMSGHAIVQMNGTTDYVNIVLSGVTTANQVVTLDHAAYTARRVHHI